MLEKVQVLSKSLLTKVIGYREHLHKNPELSFEEFETCAYVVEKLTDLGIENKIIGTTGVVAIIKGGKTGKTVALRADLDALPITEINDGRAYRSLKEGIMHACGHDVHTATLLGVAEILHTLKADLAGTYKLVFQPGEEKQPGGAKLLIEAGVLENPKVDLMIGHHVFPILNAGEVGFRPGLYMASTDEISIVIKGKGGHGAMPHFAIDTVVIAAHVILALQNIVSRIGNVAIPSVLSIGKVEAMGATNVLPNEVKLEGTFRTMDEKWRYLAHKKIKEIVVGVASTFGATAEIEIIVGYPFLKNDENLTLKSKELAANYVGENKVYDLDIWMAAEDFAYYSQAVPSVFYRFGVKNEQKGITQNVHHYGFDVDPNALETSVGMMSWLAINHANS